MWRFNFLQLAPANDNAVLPRLAGERVVLTVDGHRWLTLRRVVDGRRVLALARPCAVRNAVRRPHEAS